MLRKKDPLRKGFETLASLRMLKDRVSRIQGRIDERVAELSKRLIDLQARGEAYLARRYAEEIARLKDLSSRLGDLVLIIEKIDLAIQHAIVMKEFSDLANELQVLLRDMSRLPETRLPDISVIFADLEQSVRELSELTRSGYSGSMNYSVMTGSDVRVILEEAKEILRKRLEPVT